MVEEEKKTGTKGLLAKAVRLFFIMFSERTMNESARQL
jgi:hypothetical protein